jgi:hypothetical protein
MVVVNDDTWIQQQQQQKTKWPMPAIYLGITAKVPV